MGASSGIPKGTNLCAAVFGLAGHETLAGAAARVTVPVEFLLQWDDELVPRDSGLALFAAFASAGEDPARRNPRHPRDRGRLLAQHPGPRAALPDL